MDNTPELVANSLQLRDLASRSTFYQEQIKNAKTDTKRQYYLKKLRKNNEVFYNAIMAEKIKSSLDKRKKLVEKIEGAN